MTNIICKAKLILIYWLNELRLNKIQHTQIKKKT